MASICKSLPLSMVCKYPYQLR